MRFLFPLIAIALSARSVTRAQERWAFDPPRDSFRQEALLDLSNLNEAQAGETGWIQATESGDFAKGDGSPIRFWATVANVEREKPYNQTRSDPNYYPEPDLEHLAKWLSKRGVNMARTHAHINPDPDTQSIDDVNLKEVEWIWRTVGAMKREGIYTTVSPYWANTMESNDNRWGTDWEAQHHALLFFDETLIAAYKEWLRYLFTTPTELLDGKTLAEEPALAIFQIQNEDSLLFWTINNLTEGPKRRLGKRFGDWAIAKYGSLEEACAVWGDRFRGGDDLAEGILGFPNIWDLTAPAKSNNDGELRLDDTLQFWTETMIDFNTEIARFLREDLNCPVIVNAGNWKTADTVYLNDAERYSYTANEVIAVNRYFSSIHQGPNNGWAIVEGDLYTSNSVLQEHALSFPLNLKQVAGHPMIITESTWVYPTEKAFEGPLLVSAYSSLTGIDAYYWFATGVDDFERPRSANGWLPSQAKWVCMSPEMAGQWPAAALAFRKGYIQRGEPVVEEHRSLQSIWQRKSPIIAESPSFDPNRDSGDLPPDSSFDSGVDPYAFLAGPVTVTYDSSDAQSKSIENLDTLIESSEQGVAVTSQTGELHLDTTANTFTINAPKVQGLICYDARTAELADTTLSSTEGRCSVTLVALDDQPLSRSLEVLVQVGAETLPSGWESAPATIETNDGDTFNGKEIQSFGGPPWTIRSAGVSIEVRNPFLSEAHRLDMNGNLIEELALQREGDAARMEFPENTLYVILTGGQRYATWKTQFDWQTPDVDDQMLADPENDGFSNLLEYGMGLHPLLADRSPGPTLDLIQDAADTILRLRYQRNPLASDLDFQIQSSENLSNWQPVAIDQANAVERIASTTPGGSEQVEVDLHGSEADLGKFLRLSVSEREESL